MLSSSSLFACRYSTETNRMHSDYNITQFDFWDTYLPQYEQVSTAAQYPISQSVLLLLPSSSFAILLLPLLPPFFKIGFFFNTKNHIQFHLCFSDVIALQVFTKANAAGAMCSYAALNGVPSCANDWLLNGVLRQQWGREDAFISTDCKWY